jgi:hypothetical protein
VCVFGLLALEGRQSHLLKESLKSLAIVEYRDLLYDLLYITRNRKLFLHENNMEILKCKICGGKGKLVSEYDNFPGGQHHNGPVEFWVGCMECGVEVRAHQRSQHKIVMTWNALMKPPSKEE